jgi:hypothetical protein
MRESIVFEEDSSLGNLRDRVSGSCCHMKCFENVTYGEVEDHIFTMRELTRDEKDMYIMGKLRCQGTEIDARKKSDKDIFTILMIERYVRRHF